MSVDVINARNWELLMNAVEEHRVVPIIGDNLLQVSDDTGNIVKARQYVLDKLSERFGTGRHFTSYSEVEEAIRDYNRKLHNPGDMTDIYFEIYEIMKRAEVTMPDFMQKFFSLCQFPLVLTTSYLRGIDKLLGVRPERLTIYSKKSLSDIDPTNLSPSEPELYYLFGRLSSTRRSFKVTEDDLLDYLHCWHNSDTRPARLGGYLSDKFLLVLGCDYPNWLFRFFWHSIKNFTIVPQTPEMQGVVTVSQNTLDSDRDLLNFLSRIQTSVFSTAEDFVNEFIKRYGEREVSEATVRSYGPYEVKHEPAQQTQTCDIFISYAEEDYEPASQIAEKFRGYGASVWFDKAVLISGDRYKTDIPELIRECRRFVPVLSATTLTEGRRFFKGEWSMAIEEARFRLNDPYISPIVVDDINPFTEKRIPAEFRDDVHIIKLHDEDFDRQIKTIIRSFR